MVAGMGYGWGLSLPAKIALAKRSEEHTSDSSHVRISYAVFCLKKKKTIRLSTPALSNGSSECPPSRVMSKDTSGISLFSIPKTERPFDVFALHTADISKSSP